MPDLPVSKMEKPEIIPTPERAPENISERAFEQAPKPEQPVAVEQPVAPAVKAAASAVISEAEAQLKSIENILAEDLNDVYFNLPTDKKEIFKAKGEETAREIDKLLNEAKLQVKKIWRLIKDWLMLIPEVNKFFLEQEVKIKTDKIIRLKSR